MVLKNLFQKFCKKPFDPSLVNILIVDDIKTNILLAKSLFEKNLPNIYCDFAINGKEAVKKVKSNRYNFILMDIQMPVMNGFDATEKIREFDVDVPIITYSSRSTKAMLDAALNVGMSGYLVKPISNRMLLRTISKWAFSNRFQDPVYMDLDRVKKNLGGKRVLLADDQDIDLIHISKILENYDMKVDLVKNGQELLDLFYEKEKGEKYYYDLIITDVRMPIKSGSEVAHEIREYQYRKNEDNITKNVPIIAITGEDVKEEIDRLLKNKIDDYFIKGENITNLISQIAFWIDYHEDSIVNIKSPQEQKEIIIKSYDYSKYRVFDDSRVSNLSGHDNKEIKDLFLQTSQDLIEKIKQAASDGEVDELFVHSHSLKGAAGNIGANRLYRYMNYINESARHKIWPQDPEWIEKMDDLFVVTKKEMLNL